MPQPSQNQPRYFHRAYGLLWSSDISLNDFDSLPELPHDKQPDIFVDRSPTSLCERQGLIPINRGGVCADGVRLRWEDVVSFDTYGSDRVQWYPGPQWQGQMPQPFFSTLTALILAWRGMLPIHGSAVELNGRGYLICGRSGTGKSTLAAGLIAQGARLISDDLTAVMPAVMPAANDGGLVMARGRPSIRLFSETANYFHPLLPGSRQPEPRDRKMLIWPPMVPHDQTVPLSAIVLRDDDAEMTTHLPIRLIDKQVFRKKWMSVLPGLDQRNRIRQLISDLGPPVVIGQATRTDRSGFLEQAKRTLEILAISD